jgi:signal transduction histidine kinase
MPNTELKLRKRLTAQFVLLFVALYFLGGSVAIFMFANKLDASLDEELHDVANGALPAVEISGGKPSLVNWSRRVALRHDQLLSTIQVFDKEKNLLEEFGPAGVKRLVFGNVQEKMDLPGSVAKSAPLLLRSFYTDLYEGNKSIGYLQVQVSVKQRDEALKQIVLTMLALTPFLALSVAMCGSWFAGNAVKPVEAAMSLMRQFVMDAAHEINTPVSVIEASLQTISAELEESSADKKVTEQQSLQIAEISRLLKIIERSTNRMKNLGQSLIVLSRLESPQYTYLEEELSISQVIDSICDATRQLALSRGISFNVECEVEYLALKVRGNLDALQGMLLNLLSNAVNYSRPSGHVTLKIAYDEGRSVVKLIVADDGPGIAVESQARVFERFYRVDSSRSRNLGGCGLGLSIVKATVERHGGNISLTSVPGAGATFTVELAVAKS